MTTMSKPQSRKQAKGYLIRENYYMQDSEKGYVYSSSKELLKVLNLTQGQEVNNEIHSNLIDNRNPFDKDIKVVKNRKDNEKDRAGFDVSTNAPKSFSLLTEYYKNTNLEKYNQLIEIQKLANQKMMEKLKDYATARVRKDGERKHIKADIVYSSFLHDVTRPNLDNSVDCHVHSHNFIYNICSFEDENGKTKVVSLNNEEIMKQKMYLGQTYRNELATLLKEAGYGLELTNAKEGFFEIKGFSKEQLDTFSGRSIQIEKEMEKIREKYPLANESKLKDLANAKTKLAKKEIDREKLFKENFERMAKVGINEELIKKIESNTPVHFDRDEIKEHIKKAYKSITSLQSTFSMEELVRETLKQNVHLGVNEDYLTDLIIEDKEIVKFAKVENVYSTQTIIDGELYTIKNLQNRSFQISKNLNVIDKEVERLSKQLNLKIELTKGQKKALETIIKTDKQFMAIQGRAGSGKSFAVKILYNAYKNDYDFVGLAPTGQVAGDLQDDSGLECSTIAKYLLKERERTGKPRVIVIDESGMIDSPSMAKLIKSANENGDKIIFIGDTQQLQSVGAGKIFSDMQKYGILISEMNENNRQKDENLKEVVELIREENIDKAISKLDIQDFSDYENIEIGQNKSIEAIIRDFNKGDLVIAGTNKERDLLNIKLREKLGQDNKNEVLLTNLKNINLSGVDKYHSSTFKIGDIIQKGKIKYVVQSIKDDKTIVVKSARKDKEIIKELDIYSIENEFQLFRENKIKLAAGEEIVFTKVFENKKKEINFKNGTTGKIKKIDKNGNLEIVTEAGRELKFNIKDAPYIDYGYCLTDYKSQGLSKRVVRVLTSANNNLNSFYVQITRAMFQATIYTSNKLEFISKIKKEQKKTTTLDHLEFDPVTGEIFEKDLEIINEKLLDGWVIKTGGYEALNKHDKESANASFEVWKENRLANNQYVYSINDYVNYVQNQNKFTKKEKENGNSGNREKIEYDNEATSTNAAQSNQNAKTNGKLDSNFSSSLKSIGRGIRRARIFIERNFSRNFKTTSKNREQIISNLNILKEELGVEKIRDFKEYKTKLNSLNLVNFMATQGKVVTGHNAYFDPKKEEFRITVGSRNLNVVDYLVKAHDYNFKEASELLESAYIQQLTQKLEERKQAEKVVEIEVKETPTPVIKPNLMDIINNAKKEDLQYFVQAQGYKLDKDKSSANWKVMKNEETGDKVIINKKDEVYMYFNPDNENDKGTVYDFYKNRGISKLSEMIQLIKGADKEIKIENINKNTNSNTVINLKEIESKYKSFKLVPETNNQYLQKRGIDTDLLKLYSTIKVDEKNNIVTPMYIKQKDNNDFSFSGYNKKLANPITINKDGTDRTKPLKDLNEGNKGITILMSDNFEIKDKTTQKNIIVAESFIDALSYMQIKELEPKNTMLISTNGQQSQDMINSIKSLTGRYPNNKTILAYDNDKKGEKFADDTKQVLPNAIIDKSIAKDWNKELEEIAAKNVRSYIEENNQKINKGNTLEQM